MTIEQKVTRKLRAILSVDVKGYSLLNQIYMVKFRYKILYLR